MSRSITLMKKRTELYKIIITPDIRQRLVSEKRRGNIVVQVTSDVPDNICDLLRHRYKTILPNIQEDPCYTDNMELLDAIGSARPTVIDASDVVWVPDSFVGVYDIPKGTTYINMTDHKGITRITGGATELYLGGSSIEGTVYLQPGTTYACLKGCKGITKIEGTADILIIDEQHDVFLLQNNGKTYKSIIIDDALKQCCTTVPGANIIDAPYIPDDIKDMLVYRHTLILPGIIEEYADIMNLFGSTPPKVVNSGSTLTPSIKTRGAITVPLGTKKLMLSNRKRVTSINGGCMYLDCSNSGISGHVHLHRHTKYADFTNCINLKSISGEADVLILKGSGVEDAGLFTSIPTPLPLEYKYYIMKHGEPCKVFNIPPRYSPTKDIIVDATSYMVPDNIESLLINRYTKINRGISEGKDFIQYARLLKLMGSTPPIIGKYSRRIDVPKTYSGTLYVPKGTRYVFANGCTNLTHVVGSALYMHCNTTGIIGVFHADNVVNLDLSGSFGVTGISGTVTGKLNLNGTSV